MTDETTILGRLRQAVMDGDEETSLKAAEEAAAAGVDPQKAIMEGLAAGMAEMGRLYEEGECYVPELMVSSEASLNALRKFSKAREESSISSSAIRAILCSKESFS